MGIILKPFAMLLLFFYDQFSSYGIALILFAFVIKLVLFPVTLKSKKSMIQMNLLSGKMQRLQKQYGKDRERYNIEVQKLYAREKVNPMGGCLWSLIPMVLLIALFYIIREPLTYFMNLTTEQIQLLAQELNWETVAVANGWVGQDAMNKLLDQVSAGEIASVFQNGAYNQMYLLSLVNQENLGALQAALNAQFAGAGDGLFILNFDFLNGVDLSLIPTPMFWNNGLDWPSIGLFLLPVISVITSVVSMKISLATNKMSSNQAQNAQIERTNKMMMWMMPIMSLWIGFTVPAGLSVYWIAQYVVNMGQEVICGKILKKDYEAARLAAEEREREEKEEEKRRREEARLERARRIEEEKQNQKKKKPGQKKKEEDSDQEVVNKSDRRDGIRAYARGRAYIPDRFCGVTPYSDPDEQIRAMIAANEAARGAKKKGKPEKEAKKKEEPEKQQAAALNPAEDIPAAGEQEKAGVPEDLPVESQEPAELEEAPAAGEDQPEQDKEA